MTTVTIDGLSKLIGIPEIGIPEGSDSPWEYRYSYLRKLLMIYSHRVVWQSGFFRTNSIIS
jgi:hypothetical protein